MSYKEVRKEIADKMGDSNKLPCSVCREPTPGETLSTYGARCVACYRAYCAEGAPKRDEVPKIEPEPIWQHAWAYRLKAKRDAGIRLSPAQKHCLSVFESRHS